MAVKRLKKQGRKQDNVINAPYASCSFSASVSSVVDQMPIVGAIILIKDSFTVFDSILTKRRGQSKLAAFQ